MFAHPHPPSETGTERTWDDIPLARLPPHHTPMETVLHSAGLTTTEDPDFLGSHFCHKRKEGRVLLLFQERIGEQLRRVRGLDGTAKGYLKIVCFGPLMPFIVVDRCKLATWVIFNFALVAGLGFSDDCTVPRLDHMGDGSVDRTSVGQQGERGHF